MNEQEVTSISIEALRQAVKVMTTEAKPTSATLSAIVEIRRLIEVIDTAHATVLIKRYLVAATMKHYGVSGDYVKDDAIADDLTIRLRQDTEAAGFDNVSTFGVLIHLTESGEFDEAKEMIDDLFEALRAHRSMTRPTTRRKATR